MDGPAASILEDAFIAPEQILELLPADQESAEVD